MLILTACSNKENKAIQTAQGFAIAFQNGDWISLYHYFTPSLRELRNETDFTVFMIVKSVVDKNNFQLIYDKVVIQNEKDAYAYYTVSGNMFVQLKSPAVHLIYDKGNWYVDGFASYFTDNCAELCYDFDVCTNEVCSKETIYTCEHEKIAGCCNYNSECDSTTPYCRDNKCVSTECSSDIDCKSGDKPHCGTNGKCGECASNNDCLSFKPYCINNNCVECSTDDNCKDKNHPACKKGTCVQCTSNADCYQWGWHAGSGDDEILLRKCKINYETYVQLNECVECLSDADCKQNDIPYCSKLYNVCSGVKQSN